MKTQVLGLTISAVILACSAVGASAQNQMTPAPDQQQMQSHPMGHEEHEEEGTPPHGGMMHGGMMEGGMMGHGMMGHGMGPWAMMHGGAMQGCPPVVFRMIFALMDSDGDGTIELPEFQAAHEKIFKAMDTNKDGRVTMEEMQAFMRGTK